MLCSAACSNYSTANIKQTSTLKKPNGLTLQIIFVGALTKNYFRYLSKIWYKLLNTLYCTTTLSWQCQIHELFRQ